MRKFQFFQFDSVFASNPNLTSAMIIEFDKQTKPSQAKPSQTKPKQKFDLHRRKGKNMVIALTPLRLIHRSRNCPSTSHWDCTRSTRKQTQKSFGFVIWSSNSWPVLFLSATQLPRAPIFSNLRTVWSVSLWFGLVWLGLFFEFNDADTNSSGYWQKRNQTGKTGILNGYHFTSPNYRSKIGFEMSWVCHLISNFLAKSLSHHIFEPENVLVWSVSLWFGLVWLGLFFDFKWCKH